MTRVALCLIGVLLLASWVPATQTQSGLSPSEIEAALQLGIDHKPQAYPLYRDFSKNAQNAVPVAFAYTPFIRVALAAYTMLHEKGISPAAGDVAAFGEDGFVYIGLLDFVLVDNKPWIRDANIHRVVGVDLTPTFDPSRPLSYVGRPAAWASWTRNALEARKLDFGLPVATFLVGAFSRDALSGGGYIVAHVAATNSDGDKGTMINYAVVRPGEAVNWR